MAVGTWYVLAEAPPQPTKLWDYPAGFFPRRYYYPEDAEMCQREVIRRGGQKVHVEYRGVAVKRDV